MAQSNAHNNKNKSSNNIISKLKRAFSLEDTSGLSSSAQAIEDNQATDLDYDPELTETIAPKPITEKLVDELENKRIRSMPDMPDAENPDNSALSISASSTPGEGDNGSQTQAQSQPVLKAESNELVRSRTIVAYDDRSYQVGDDIAPEVVGFYGNTKDDIETYLALYQKLVWAFRCVYEISTSCAQVPLLLYDPPEDVDDSLDDITKQSLIKRHRGLEVGKHPIKELLKRPNNSDTRFMLWWKTFSYLNLTGNAYWFLERDNPMGEPVKIHVPRPDRVIVIPKKNGTKSFARRVNDKTEDWAAKDVIHFMSFNPLSDFFGFPTAASAQDSMIIELYSIRFDKSYFLNADRPKQYLSTPDGVLLDDIAYERLKSEMKRLHTGVDNFHKTAVLEGGTRINELTNKTHADSDFLEHKRRIAEEIFMGFGCHHLAIMQRAAGNRATLDTAYKMFWELTNMPLLQNVCEMVEKDFLTQFDDGKELSCSFDLRSVSALRESILIESQADARYVQLGIKTINEVREDRNFGGGAPVSWGNKPPLTAPFALPGSRNEANNMRSIMEPSNRPRNAEEAEAVQDGGEDGLNGSRKYYKSLINDELLRQVLQDEIHDALSMGESVNE